jgi:hypothetical protein
MDLDHNQKIEILKQYVQDTKLKEINMNLTIIPVYNANVSNDFPNYAETEFDDKKSFDTAPGGIHVSRKI